MSYSYKDPVDNGFQQVDIPKKYWDELPFNTSHKWAKDLNFYIRDGELMVYSFRSISLKIFITVVFPFYALIMPYFSKYHTIMNTFSELYEIYREREAGSFHSTHCQIENLPENIQEIILDSK